MHGHGLSNNETIRHKLADCLTRVGIADLVDFVRIKPDLALSTADDRRCKALLSLKIDPAQGSDRLLNG